MKSNLQYSISHLNRQCMLLPFVQFCGILLIHVWAALEKSYSTQQKLLSMYMLFIHAFGPIDLGIMKDNVIANSALWCPRHSLKPHN